MNHTFAIRAAAALLSCLTLTGLISCGGDSADPSSVTENAATEAVTEPQWLDSLPSDLDFGGEAILIRTRGDSNTMNEVDIVEEDGDVLNDAIFRRNREIEDRLNVSIAVSGGESWSDYAK